MEYSTNGSRSNMGTDVMLASTTVVLLASVSASCSWVGVAVVVVRVEFRSRGELMLE